MRFIRCWGLLGLALLLLPCLSGADCTPVQLNTLLTADADGLGFGAMIAGGHDGDILEAANLVRAGGTYQVIRNRVPVEEIKGTFDDAEYAALTTTQLQKLTVLTASGYLDMTKQATRNILRDIFPAGGPTRAALTALATTQVSWAVLRCGRALVLGDISFALRGTR